MSRRDDLTRRRPPIAALAVAQTSSAAVAVLPSSLSEYFDYLTLELQRSPRTAEHYVYCIKSLCKWAGKAPEQLTADDLRAFKRHPDFAPSTKQTYVVAMHSFHDWGVLEGRWQPGPIRAVATPRVIGNPKPPIPIYMVRRMLESCRTPNEYRVVYLGLYAGCRIHESASMTATDWFSDRLTFIGKGSKQRTVPVHPELQRVRDSILSTQPASVGVLHSVFAKFRDRLGIVDAAGSRAPSHAMRRTFGSWLYDECDVPYEVIAALLGHGKTVTNQYAPIRFPKLQRAVFSLDYYGGEPVQLQLFDPARLLSRG
jgi:integrase